MSNSQNNKNFKVILLNSLIASVTNSLVWFSITYWVFLETQSILLTSLIAGVFAALSTVTATFFGSFVDKHKKKKTLFLSTIISLVCYLSASVFYFVFPNSFFIPANLFYLWVLIFLCVIGSVAGNLRNIAQTTIVTIFFDEEERAKANGLVGIVGGISFGITSVLSGFLIGFYGMGTVLLICFFAMFLVFLHLFIIEIPEVKFVASTHSVFSMLDILETLNQLKNIKGLFVLILFTTFNNMLGGVFMALMDAYGLSLVSVQAWGTIFGFLSLNFILSGFLISKYGVGENPLKTLFVLNMVTWVSCIFFTSISSIYLLIIGISVWMICMPFIEASEQTIMQKVVPLERQGRIIGVSQTLESSAMPITTLLIGPLTHFIFIPFMTDGLGAQLIGDYFGTGSSRAIALVFTVTGILGFLVTLYVKNTSALKLLKEEYFRDNS